MLKQLPDYASVGLGAPGKPSDYNRFNTRWSKLFQANVHAIEGKVIVDLACNNGRMSFPCIQLGAKKVIGVEARPELIAEGKAVFEKLGISDRMEWHQDDLFRFLASIEPGSVDTILCLGFLYHTTRHIDFFREIDRIRPRYAIVDTNVAKNYIWIGRKHLFKKPPALFVYQDNAIKTSDTTDADGIVYWPSTSYLEEMYRKIGYNWKRIDYHGSVKDWSGMDDYKKGTRVSYIGERI